MISCIVNSHMDYQSDLERLYRDARYEVDLPSGACWFHIGDGLPQLKEVTFALITAYNPGSHRPSHQENEVANSQLRRRLDERGWTYAIGRGMSADRAHVEPSFAVFGISRAEATSLARHFGQAAIVWFDGHTAELAWTSEASLATDT